MTETTTADRQDIGDGLPFTSSDVEDWGLAKGMERYLV